MTLLLKEMIRSVCMAIIPCETGLELVPYTGAPINKHAVRKQESGSADPGLLSLVICLK